MNIKTIVDKIATKADLNPLEYTVAERVDDLNEWYMYYIEKAVQLGSNIPIAIDETNKEEFNITKGSNELARTMFDYEIVRVDFKEENSDTWKKVKKDYSRLIGGCPSCEITYFADEKRIFIENGRKGKIRVTYANSEITPFTVADYSNVNPPEPEYIPLVFRKLLYLAPATIKAQDYNKERASLLQVEWKKVEQLFINHYSRNSIPEMKFEVEEDY